MSRQHLEAKSPLWRRVTLRDVIFFTLPPMLLVLWLAGSAMLDYHRVRQFDDWWSNATSVRKFAWYRVRSLLRAPQMSEIEHRLTPDDESKPVLRLDIPRQDFDRIDGDVGAHWGEWTKASIVQGNEIRSKDLLDAKFRFRGDGSAHWTTEKKSFTLKTKRGGLYNGFRTMAFSVKDVFPQWLVGTLEKDFGLLAPEQDLVPVYLNERFYGLHRFVEPIDESFLRRHIRLPGNIFRADTAERGDYFKGLPREVFMNPFIWDRVANNDRPGAIGTKKLGEMITALNTSTFEEHERFMALFDREELSRLLAFLLVCGDPYHMSGIHNQFWYEDPSDDKLHPIPWDVRLLDLTQPPHGANINRFWRAVLKDPRVWDGAMREVAQWLKDDTLLKLAEQRVNKAATHFKNELAYDNLRAGVIPPVGTPQETLAILRKNLETLKGWLGDAHVTATVGDATSYGGLLADVVVSGRASVELVGFQLPAAVHPQDQWELWADANRNGAFDFQQGDLSCAVKSESARLILERPLPLAPGVTGTAAALDAQPIAYRFFLLGSHYARFSGSEVTVLLRNALTGEPINAVAAASGGAIRATASLQLSLQGDASDKPRILSGKVHLVGNMTVGDRESLTVEPGTALVLDPDVSIFVKGNAVFRGTEKDPITIQRSNPDLPWGVIALQGDGASGSRFEHVKFLGGGGGLLEDIEYTGSICVHNATGVVFDHCEIANNSRCDDGLHVDRGDVTVTNCWFHDCNADSLDLDMSTAFIAHNKIERSGNDGFDLMTCNPRIIDNDITGSADKGISVGEDSSPFVFDNRIQGCERGIEVKDRSAPIVLNTSISGCKRGVYAHIKNWRYGEAGWPKLAGSIVAGNEADWVAADDARMTLAGSQLGPLSDALPGSEDLAWLYALQGVATSTAINAPGPLADYKLVDPVQPLYEGRFEEDFVDPTDGWKHSGSLSRLHKRAHDLVANIGKTRGAFGLEVDLDLGDATRKYVLVLEIAGEGVEQVSVTATSKAGDVSAPIELAPVPTTYRYATVELAPRRYDGLLLFASPTQSRSRIALHSWRVMALPLASGGK
jgi:parallel beta-helix repeat protein